MAREQVIVQAQQAVIYDGTADVTCDSRDQPHVWTVRLRCSAEELERFRALRAGQSVRVELRGAGVGRAEFAGVDPPAHVRLTGLGLCPYPDH